MDPGSPGVTQMQPKGRSTTSYIPGLDGIRAIAFLLVFGAHSTPGKISLFIPATLGVTIFFFLSGFLITTLLRKEMTRTGTLSLRDFYIRRTLRIFIPLYVVYGLAAAFARLVPSELPGNGLGFLSMFFYCFNYAHVMGIHATLPPGLQVIWSLAVEEHFYILFPLIYLLMVRARISLTGQMRLLVGFCVLELIWRFVLVLVFHQGGNWTYFATDARLDSILWGCILALNNNPVFGDRSILPRGREKLTFAAAVFVLACSLVPRSILYKESFRYTLQALCLYLIFSFVLPNIRHRSVRWLEWTPLRYIGWISYVLYLCHVFILDGLTYRFPHKLWLTSPLGLLLAILFATLTRYTLELPLQRLRARFRHVAEVEPPPTTANTLVPGPPPAQFL
jgi:peptidoglycan/LPS O-acetylase OafA/YrhL